MLLWICIVEVINYEMELEFAPPLTLSISPRGLRRFDAILGLDLIIIAYSARSAVFDK